MAKKGFRISQEIKEHVINRIEVGGISVNCDPQQPYGYPHKDSKIITVDGYELAIPVYLKEKQGLSNPWVSQLIPKVDNQMIDRMNFLNNPRGVSDTNQDFRITPENPLGKRFWKKDVEPTLIHALETFEVKPIN